MGECVPSISVICISAQNSLVAKDFHRFYQPYFSSIICQSRKYPQKVLRFAAVQSSGVRIQAQPFYKDPTARCPTAVAQFASFRICGWSYTESKPAAATNVHVMIGLSQDWAACRASR
jgi:hypothetical protein